MDWFSKILQVAAGVLGLLTLAAIAWVAFRGSFNKARVAELREDNKDLRERLGDAEAKLEAHKLKEEALETKVNYQQTEIEMLTDMVTRRAEVGSLNQGMIDLIAQMKDHHDGAVSHWSAIETGLAALLSDKEKKS